MATTIEAIASAVAQETGQPKEVFISRFQWVPDALADYEQEVFEDWYDLVLETEERRSCVA